jgi:thiazole synthase ThiGH ThiG subunit
MPDTKEMFDMVLRLLEREDQLVNSRMTWYLTIQGFIVASVALAFTGKFESHPYLQIPAIILLSILGIAISAVVYVAVRRARDNKKKVGQMWEKADKAKTNLFPDPRGEHTSWWANVTPGQAVPVIFVVFWIMVIMGASV